MKLLVVFFLFLQIILIFAHTREFIQGEVGSNSRVALQDFVSAAPCSGTQHEVNRTFTVNSQISGIWAVDIMEGPSIATVDVVSGGIGQSEVQLRFGSPIIGHGIHFRVTIFGW